MTRLPSQHSTPRTRWNSTIRCSDSKPVARSSTPKRGAKPLSRKAIKRKRRSPEDFARIYGPKERVAWVKDQPCVWCVARGLVRLPVESHNAHVKSGGMGYKAGFRLIVPLCPPDHFKYDNHLTPFDKPSTRLAVQIYAKLTEERWQAYQADVKR